MIKVIILKWPFREKSDLLDSGDLFNHLYCGGIPSAAKKVIMFLPKKSPLSRNYRSTNYCFGAIRVEIQFLYNKHGQVERHMKVLGKIN